MALMTTFLNDPIFNEMDRTFGALLPAVLGPARPRTSGSPTSSLALQPGTLHLAMDIIETPTGYEVHADAPGMRPEDVRIELHDGVLTIAGSRKVSHTANPPAASAAAPAGGSTTSSPRVWRSERASYSFSRALTLPDNADSDNISASIEHGVLRVAVPKLDKQETKQEPKRIAVTSA